MIRITESFGSSNRNFGNKLFTYAVARIFSKELNQNLSIPKKSHIRRGGHVMNFPYGDVNGLNDYEGEVYVSDHSMIDKGLDLTLKESFGKGVYLDGYFLKYGYIRNHKSMIRDIYSDLILENDNKNDVVIMMRDSNADDTFKLPDEYYMNILDGLEFNNLYVCYDHFHKHKSLFDKIDKYSPIYIDENIIDVFKFITSKNTIIACQGTFSFWAGFLSNATKIYWPITTVGPNKKSDPHVELTVDDEDRYEFVYI